MKKLLFLLIGIASAVACSENPEPVPGGVGTLNHKKENHVDAEHLEEFNDPFFLDSVYIAGTELRMEVSYSGGCGEHDFTVVWPEVITMVYPPDFGISLHHNANGDNCEALIHDTLKVDLTDTPVGEFDAATISKMRLTVENGSRPEESRSTR